MKFRWIGTHPQGVALGWYITPLRGYRLTMLVIKKHRVHRALFEFKGHREIVSPKGVHAFMSHDRNYVVSDVSVGGWWHGCAWQVYFHSR